MSAHKDWLVSCTDIAGRRRELIIRSERGRVVITAPPGETAVLAPPEAGRLRTALEDAIINASRG